MIIYFKKNNYKNNFIKQNMKAVFEKNNNINQKYSYIKKTLII